MYEYHTQLPKQVTRKLDMIIVNVLPYINLNN